MLFRRVVLIGLPVAINVLLSWTILPLAIPPFRAYSPAELFEVLLWQGIAAVGWPMALVGAALGMLFQPARGELGPLLLLLIYPAILFLLLRSASAGKARRWELVTMHLLITFSFVLVWHGVLNGYDFMAG